MKKKNLISLSVALVFATLGTTGLLLYTVQHNKATTGIHTLFGLLFVAFAILHIINNWSSLVSYMKPRTGTIQKEFLVVLAIGVVFIVATGLRIPPFGEVEEFGEELRRGGGEGRGGRPTLFAEVKTNESLQGRSLIIYVQKNRDAVLPVMTVWSEDSTGQFIDNLFVPAQLAEVEGDEDIQEALREGELEFKPFDAARQPAWNGVTKDKQANYPQATPFDNFILTTRTRATGTFVIKAEITVGGKSEVYQTVISSADQTGKLGNENGTLLRSALIELQ